jgi:hypothetical protein
MQAEKRHEREMKATAEARAVALAEELTAKRVATHEKKLERLQDRLAAREEQLSEAKAKHLAELKEQGIKLRAEADGEAMRKAKAELRAELRKKDRALQSFQDQIAVQQRRIEHLTADERGELNEERLLQELRAAFPDDTLERLGRGRAGGDILHEVRVRSDGGLAAVGRIVYECKDTQVWSNSFLAQARKEAETHDTPYVVVISRAFPSKQKTLFVKDGIVVVDPARAVDLALVMRRMVAEVHRAALTAEGQQAKSAELCEYLGSTEFRRAFDVVADSGERLAELLGKERKWHEQTWAKRQSIYTEIGSKTTAIDARISTIIEKRAPSRGAKVVALR